MKEAPVTDILRRVRFLSADDGLGKVVSLFQASQAHALPVTHNGRVVGLVTEKACSRTWL